MLVSSWLYHSFVRPRWLTKKYIHDQINQWFDLHSSRVLDFGAGTGANCGICHPRRYLGIDPDEKRIHFAKRVYPTHRFEVFNGKHIPVAEHSIDFILIVAVLHHIATTEINEYMREFHRVLNPEGTIIVIEPYLCERRTMNNRFMNWFDKGDYIRSAAGYTELFRINQFECSTLKQFTKCLLYNEFFFTAKKAHPGKSLD